MRTILPYDVSATLWPLQQQQCHRTSPVIISPPCSFLSLAFDRYFSISFQDGCLRLYLRYFLVDPCPIMRACVCLSMSVYTTNSSSQHSRSKSSTKPLDLPIQNSDSARFCSHVIPSHRPTRNTHLMSLTRRILTDHSNPRSSRLH